MRDMLTDYLTPGPVAIRRRDQAVWNDGEALDVTVDGVPVAAVRLGDGPMVLLVHGWQGRAGQLSSLARRLTEAGYGVVLADMPAHGLSRAWTTDNTANFGQFAQAIGAVASTAGGVYGVVGHSGGALSALMAMTDGLSVQRFVGIGMLPRLRQSVDGFLRRHDATEEEATAMQRGMVDRFGADVWDRTDAHHARRRMTACPSRVLVVHDADDDAVPVADAQALVDDWPDAEILVTQRLGHHLVLRRPEVADGVLDALG